MGILHDFITSFREARSETDLTPKQLEILRQINQDRQEEGKSKFIVGTGGTTTGDKAKAQNKASEKNNTDRGTEKDR